METKHKFTTEEQVEFVRGLYTKCNEELEKIYSLHKENKDKLLKEIAFILLLYNINNNIMDLSYSEKSELKEKFGKLIVKYTGRQVKLTDSILTAILMFTVKDTFKFYGYKYTLEEVKDIVHRKYKGKLYTDRIKTNENNVGDYLYGKIDNFLDGKIDVNTINDDIEATYKTNKDNVVTLAETELSRSENIAFLLFAKSVGIAKVIRNEVLDDRICGDCEDIAGEIFDLEDAPSEMHPRCRGFNEIYYSNGVES